MPQRILAVILGFFTGFVLVILVQMISAKLYPPPEDLLTQDVEALKRYFTALPGPARIIILAAHVLGAFGGSFVASKFANSYKFYIGLIVGFILLIASISSNLGSYVPALIFILDTLLTIGAMLLGARLGSKVYATAKS